MEIKEENVHFNQKIVWSYVKILNINYKEKKTYKEIEKIRQKHNETLTVK